MDETPKVFRTVVTERSVWHFNLTDNMYLREPVDEANRAHPNVPYSGTWEPFVELVESAEWRLTVIRPVPWGEGQMRQLGPILYDTTQSVRPE